MSGTAAQKVSIEPAAGAADMARVHALFVEYADWLDFDLCFQGFDEELATLPGKYAPPEGGLWLARVGGGLAGVVGLRPLDPGICELKRLWVRPAFRGHGLGRRLTQTAIDAARKAGYRTLRLDTIGGQMQEARALYDSLGFRETAPYYRNPHPGADYLALDLRASGR
jgi:ribosomal protein S18 acetylase RimI-like enzyme